ncbi:IMP dehydrogenase, partial [Pseudoalteromonas sp. S327]
PGTGCADLTKADATSLSQEKGCSGFPVTASENNLLGIVTARDMRFEPKLEQPVSRVMTKKDKLVTFQEGASGVDILGLMHEHRIENILLVDDAFKVIGMKTV